ncbi:MAG: pyridoxal phosphate-dependent aminotransferase [[Clostridium] aminophilum]|uniref:pyridoxal phosphate-dependent aminotransferase n=1 Tax=[Clostridium] aminophilum TaxID=1526 RepID=UPI0026EEB9D2|nr:pyridoxal phosphate-dependent aminotransferase [[Clostridium] aminophilum]MDD6196525.1 pyridoxal phosphate-dependent aminotransferase [[Clostridium] aminophilum]
MISEKMMPLLRNNSAIRMMFEEGNRLAALYGRENVYDFSLGNPSVPAPPEVNQAIRDVLEEEDTLLVHGYMSNSGYEDVRQAIAQSLNDRFGTGFGARNLIMTVGAASALNIILKAVLNPDDEVLTFAPYFVEYGNYVRNYDGKLVVVPADTETFQPNLAAFRSMINKRTRAVIINTPNNPTGVIYSGETIRSLAAILEEKQKEFGTEILLISDEPYRELAYDGIEVPYVTKFYANSVVCYSYSKSLSLPGERIGYALIPDEVSESGELIAAAAIANRVIGSVNAPSLIQRVIRRCLNAKVNVEAYDRNRSALYDGLTNLGFECVRPQGAFYMWVKSPVKDEKEFCDVCREHHILVVPGSSFACGGYVRIAYCVSYDMIERSMPAFAKVAERYGLNK